MTTLGQADATYFANEYHNATTVHPLGLAMLLGLSAVMLLVPRRYATWPIIVMACFVSQAQRVVIGSLDFDFLRVLVLVAGVRILLRSEVVGFCWRSLDTMIAAYAVGHLVTGLLRVGPSIAVNKLGFVFDVVGMYCAFRILVRDWDDVRSVVLGFALVAIPVAAFFFVEMVTRRNAFSVFGGVNAITSIREGRLRCQGAFAHPILAGVFWASLLPLFGAMFLDGRRRVLAAIAMVCTLVIVVACSSATPVTAVMFGVIGAAAFFLRGYMGWIRWGLVFVLLGLHLVMKAPVWHLISRIDIVGGNSGYHRYQLIDGAIRHFDEWWLIGSRVGTEHWGHHTYDVTNAYLVQGLHGGVGLLAAFVVVIASAFRSVGRTWRREAGSCAELWWSWALGVSLFVHVTSFIAITYFGQSIMLWHLSLALIGSMGALDRDGAYRTDIAPELSVRISPTG